MGAMWAVRVIQRGLFPKVILLYVWISEVKRTFHRTHTHTQNHLISCKHIKSIKDIYRYNFIFLHFNLRIHMYERFKLIHTLDVLNHHHDRCWHCYYCCKCCARLQCENIRSKKKKDSKIRLLFIQIEQKKKMTLKHIDWTSE